MKLTPFHFDVTFKVAQERVTHLNIWKQDKEERQG